MENGKINSKESQRHRVKQRASNGKDNRKREEARVEEAKGKSKLNYRNEGKSLAGDCLEKEEVVRKQTNK